MRIIQTFAYLACAALMVLVVIPGQSSPRAASPQFAPRQLQRANEPASETEWDEVVRFMEANCPNRMNFVQTRLANKPIERENFKKRMIEMYRQLKGIKNDKDLVTAMIAQWRAADNVFGAQLQWREGMQQGDARKQMLAQSNLRRATEDLVDAEIVVKQARVQKLQSEVMDLMKRRQQLAKDRYSQEMNIAKNPTMPPTGKGAGDVFAAPEKPPENKK